jgi:subtilisin family serine protease
MRTHLTFAILFLVTCLCAQTPETFTETLDHRLGEVLFQTVDNASVNVILAELNGDNLVQTEPDFKAKTISQNQNIHHLFFNPNLYDEKEILTKLKFHRLVMAAQYNHIAELRSTPNDSLYSEQWNMNKIGLPSVWDVTTGGTTACGDTIVVAVLDRGFDIKHKDLKANIFHNRFEIPNNGKDDDGNGYIDDVDGWNFEYRNDDHVSDAHGTNCAGVIGAVGNNKTGVVGVNWNIKMLILSGVTDDAKIVEAYTYACNLRKNYNRTNGQKGAFVAITSMSLGYRNKRPEDFPLICSIYNELGKNGLLNVVSADNIENDINVSGDVPGLCASEHLLVVTRTDNRDLLPRTAGYSNKYVHLAAPGESILTTSPGNSYDEVGGNSFAAPLVAGAAALLLSLPQDSLCKMAKKNPTEAIKILKQAILRGVDPIPALKDKTVSGGRLNPLNSFNLLRRWYGMPTGDFQILKMYPNPATTQLNLQLQLPQSAAASIEITNSVGQTVLVRKIEERDLLDNKISINTEGLGVGIYFLSVSAEDYKATSKFVVVKNKP